MEEIFGPGGLIAQHHPNYEFRPGQVEMADAVNNIINDGGIALIEAGTGTGKTLAYLIPALAAGKRVLVSTATKNLQEQLHKKDVPFLQITSMRFPNGPAKTKAAIEPNLRTCPKTFRSGLRSTREPTPVSARSARTSTRAS